MQAHRLSWKLHNGPIPNGILVLHRCDNPPCSSDGKSWLTVHTEGRDSGVSYAYQRYVAVPRPLNVTRRGAPVEITLRKVDGEIQIVDLR